MKGLKTTSRPLFIPASLAWFGFQCGAGFSSGKQVWLYAGQYGLKGFAAPVISWIIAAAFTYIVAEYARLTKAQSYKDVTGIISRDPHIRKIVLLAWDILVFMSSLTVCSSCTAGFGSLLENMTKIPYYPGCLLFAAGMSLLLCCGKSLLERMGNFSLILAAVFFAVCITAVCLNRSHLAAAFSGAVEYVPIQEASLFGLCRAGVIYGIAMTSFFQICSAFAGQFKSRRETCRFITIGFLINVSAMLIAWLAIMAYYPECGENSMPLYYIVSHLGGCGGQILMLAYDMILIFACITSVGAQVIGAQARYTKLLLRVFKSEKVCIVIIVLVFMLGSMALSRLGLGGVIETMNNINGVCRFPCWVLPVFILGPRALRRLNTQKPQKGAAQFPG